MNAIREAQVAERVEQTVAYPECQRGREDDNWAHRFLPAAGLDRGGFSEVPVMLCSACGQVRKLEVPW